MTRPDIASQRCFYDKHGYPSETLRQKELPDIFDWSPKFGIYEEEMLADEETTHVEEWMAAQVSIASILGSWHTAKISSSKRQNLDDKLVGTPGFKIQHFVIFQIL